MPRIKVYQAIYEGFDTDGNKVAGKLAVGGKPIIADNYIPQIHIINGKVVNPYSVKFLKMEEVKK